jgi:DNA-binding NtrC family response regulator
MVKRILVVDDERSVAFLLSENLAELDPCYQVQVAHSGEEALSRVVAKPFDLIITDLRMPGMDGLELIRHVQEVSPDTRTILITAYGDKDVEQEAGNLGVYRYVTKPFKTDEFTQIVEQALLDDTPVPQRSRKLKEADILVQGLGHRTSTGRK